ncbi:MAG: DUF4157 domain-containing protein [Chloroflexota bacterium]
MPAQISRIQVSRDAEAALKRQPAGFQEVPGETEAEAVRDAFLRGAGPAPEQVASALSGADSVARARALGRLQRERGNAYVQRVVAESRGLPGRLVGLSQPEMVEEVHQRKDSGSGLPDGTRQQMEGFFGAELGDLRVHAGGEAATLSRELNANAFTVGRDIFFADGKFSPHTTEGQATLAHEITHVGQQTGFTPPAAQREGEEDELQMEAIQRAAEEDELQMEAIQREGAEEEEMQA